VSAIIERKEGGTTLHCNGKKWGPRPIAVARRVASRRVASRSQRQSARGPIRARRILRSDRFGRTADTLRPPNGRPRNKAGPRRRRVCALKRRKRGNDARGSVLRDRRGSSMAVDAVSDSAADSFRRPAMDGSRPNPGNGKIEITKWRYNDAATARRIAR